MLTKVAGVAGDEVKNPIFGAVVRRGLFGAESFLEDAGVSWGTFATNFEPQLRRIFLR